MIEPNERKLEEYRAILTCAIEGTVAWRSEVVTRFPDDDRNEPAVLDLSRLAETVKDVPDGLMSLYIAIYGEDAYDGSEREGEMLRSVGFRRHYKNADEFLRDLVA